MRRIKVIFMLVMLLFSLTGCWDSTETEKLGVVTLMGIGLDSENNIEVIIQEIGEKNKSNFKVYSESGATVSEALEKMALNNHHRIYLGHTKEVVLSEELAATKGISPVIDFFQRNGEIRPTAKILISKSEQLTRVMSDDLGLDSDTGTILEDTIKNKKNSPNIIAASIKEFIELINEPGSEVYTSGIGLKSRDINIKHSNPSGSRGEIFDFGDIAVFKDDIMTDWLKGDEARGFLWVKGNAKGSYITVPFESGNLSCKIVRVKSSIKPLIENNKMYININVNVTSNIEESQHITDYMDESVINKIEQTQNEKIKDEISAAVNKSKNLRQDIFGFGYYFYTEYPSCLKEIKDINCAYYPDINVNINVNSTIGNIKVNYKPLVNQ